jgi:hypothetical protein
VELPTSGKTVIVKASKDMLAKTVEGSLPCLSLLRQRISRSIRQAPALRPQKTKTLRQMIVCPSALLSLPKVKIRRQKLRDLGVLKLNGTSHRS